MVAGLSLTMRVGHPATPSSTVMLTSTSPQAITVGGGDGRAATMVRMMNDASVTKPTQHKHEGKVEKKEWEGRGEGGDGRTRKFQDNVNSKAINCNKDNSDGSDNNDQSDCQKQ